MFPTSRTLVYILCVIYILEMWHMSASTYATWHVQCLQNLFSVWLTRMILTKKPTMPEKIPARNNAVKERRGWGNGPTEVKLRMIPKGQKMKGKAGQEKRGPQEPRQDGATIKNGRTSRRKGKNLCSYVALQIYMSQLLQQYKLVNRFYMNTRFVDSPY